MTTACVVNGNNGSIYAAAMLRDLAILAGAFVGATAIAVAAGAENLGTAMGFGQIAFALALAWVLLRR